MIATLRRRPQIATPFDALWDVRRDLDRIFDTFAAPVDTTTALPAEVVETEGEVRFLIEIPGLKPEDIELTVENSVLTVSGEKRWQKVEGEAKGEYHVMERKYGRFARAFSLPHKVDSTAIEARYEQGVLTVTLPKAEEAKPRRIQVRAGEPAREIEAK
jgi:HSP20 family protein